MRKGWACLLEKISNTKLFLFLPVIAILAISMPNPAAAQVDMNRSFMQVLDATHIRIRNIVTNQGIFRESYQRVGNDWILVAGSSRLEGTNQRRYVITERPITVDGNKQDWGGIAPAFIDPAGDSTNPNPGTDLKGVYLAKDQIFLYVLITLYGAPIADGTVTYFFQARLLPEDDSFSYYAGARLVPGPSPVSLALHFKPKLTTLPSLGQGTAMLNTYQQYAAYGFDGNEGVVEFKVPLSDFPLEAIVGKYVDAWVEAPPYPSREDSTASQEGVYLELGGAAATMAPATNLLLEK
jgi:hypothetical protein